MIQNNNITFFAILESGGELDSYIFLLLKGIVKYCNRLIIIVGGNLLDSERRKLESFSDDILIEHNHSDDALYLYKVGIKKIGIKELAYYSNAIFLNSSIMGPVNSIEKMFRVMLCEKLDFWGVTKKYKIDSKTQRVIEYLQTYFVVFSKRILTSKAFIEFWIKKDIDYGIDECELTFFFQTHDYKWSAYVNTDDIKEYSYYPLMFLTEKLVKERNCPFFEKKIFSYNYAEVLSNTNGTRSKKFLDYLEYSKKYDIDLVWQSILKTENMEDIARNLGLSYVLSTSKSNGAFISCVNVALVMHIYYEDLLDYMIGFAKNVPDFVDVYITIPNNKIFIEIEDKVRKNIIANKVKIIPIENRGRDVSSLLVGMKEYVNQYDLVCFVHDKKTPQIGQMSIGQDFANLCYDNIIQTKEYVDNVIELFQTNPRLGLAYPPFPAFADLYSLLGSEWGPNYEMTNNLLEELNIHVPVDAGKRPFAPYGTCFWFRTKALRKLYDKDWEYDDFPVEPNKVDGTILHAVERAYPFVVQDAGFYPAMIIADNRVGTEYFKLDFYIREYNKRLFSLVANGDFSYILSKLEELNYCKRKDGKIVYNPYYQKQGITKKAVYLFRDVFKRILPRSIFVSLIKVKRKMFGPYKDYEY